MDNTMLNCSGFFYKGKNPYNFPKLNISLSKGDFNKTKLLSIFDISYNQDKVNSEVVKIKMKNKSKWSIPHIVLYKGIYICIDGHHTLCALISLGKQSKIKCKVLEIK